MSKHYSDNVLSYAKHDVYSAFNPAAISVVADIHGASMTRQEFADECDINQIMARYEKDGIWPPVANDYVPVYVDFAAQPTDLMSAMQQMSDAEAAFMRLPAIVRKEFDNDAVRFVEYAANGDNLEQLRRWGLAEPEKAPDKPLQVEVVNPSPPIAPEAAKA